MQFVDANIFLRYLTQDPPNQAQACHGLFLKAQRNEIELTTSEAIISEVVYVLSSKRLYGLTREDIRNSLYPLLTLSGLKLAGRSVFLRALDLYVAYRLDFEDALAIAHMEHNKISEILTYDREFDQVAGVQRIEP
jgi:predicted nucleic acid-binding protein